MKVAIASSTIQTVADIFIEDHYTSQAGHGKSSSRSHRLFTEHRRVRTDVDEKQDEDVILFLVKKQEIATNVALANTAVFPFQCVIAVP